MRIRELSVALCTLLCGSSLHAQALDRSQRPVAPPPKPFKLPPLAVDTLPNGLHLIVIEDHSIPVVAVRVVVDADSSLDPAGKDGVSRLMLDALREGTTSRSADQLAAAGAAIGTSVAPTSFTTTTAAFAPALELMADMLMHPAFDSAGIERRKAQQAARVRAVVLAPATPARRVFYSSILGADDPFARTLSANPAAVATLTRADVTRAYADYLVPATTTIVIAGDVTNRSARDEVAKVFGAWRGRATATSANASPPPARPTTIYLVDAPGNNAVMYIGTLGPKRSEAGAGAAEVMASVIAARFQSELRDRLGLIYSGTAGFIWRTDPLRSVFVGSTAVDAKRVDSALVVALRLFREVRAEHPATAPEINAGIQRLVGPLPSRIDGADSLATTVSDLVRDNLPPDYRERYARTVTAVTASEVAAAAQKYLDTDHLVIVVSGDRKITEPALRAANIGPVVVVDAAGNPIR